MHNVFANFIFLLLSLSTKSVHIVVTNILLGCLTKCAQVFKECKNIECAWSIARVTVELGAVELSKNKKT